MNGFDLEKAIAAWRRTLEHTRSVSADDLRELEAHLRDHTDWLRAEGRSEEHAFHAALRALGDAATTEAAYERVYWRKARHGRRLGRALTAEAGMLANYAKVGLRALGRHPGYAVLNVVGLAVGLACCLLIALYVRHELSYDRFHRNAERIFRVGTERIREDATERLANAPVPLGPALEASVPGVERAVRFWRAFQPVVHYRDHHAQEEGFYYTDDSVFEVFSFDLVAGDPATALAAPGTVVLTESTARRYFGDEAPLGQVIRVGGYPVDTLDLTVTAVVRDLPEHTQFDFDFLASLEGIATEADNFGSFKPIWTYVLLAPGSRPEALTARLQDFAERRLRLPGSSTRYALSLEPLRDVHLRSTFSGGFKPAGDVRYVYLFSAVGLFILLLAAINFMNLATARSMRRAKEVGMRKVLGAHRRQLAAQFMGEAFLLAGLALVVALALAYVLLPVFNALSGRTLALGVLRDGFTVATLAGLAAGIGALAGVYPALFLSAFRPIAVLKGSPLGPARGGRLRQTLVVFQFTVSCALLVATTVVYRQLGYVRSRPLGFDREHVVVLPYSPAADAIRADLLADPRVLATTVSQRVPANHVNYDGRQVVPEGQSEQVQVESYIVDAHFVPAFGIELAAGRAFSEARPSDAAGFLINETAVKRFGWSDPTGALGREIEWSGQKRGPVLGVVRDFHTTSLHEPMPAVVIQLMPEAQWWRTFLSVRIRPGDVPATLRAVEAAWRRHTPGGAYRYFFLDEAYDAMYRSDERFGRLFSYFAGLAGLIACLGLFGLAAYTAEQRTKEIGIRKVLGASVPGLVVLIAGDFLRLVGLAFVLAIPVAYLGMDRWLEGFAYRAPLSWHVFALAGLAVLVLAGLTVGSHALRTATGDPVKALRYE